MGPSSSLPAVVARLDKKHANRIILCWSGMTDTEHNDSYERREEASVSIGREIAI